MASKRNRVPERRDDLIVQKLGDEVIVYDRVSHRAHSLNRTAALVFEKLDGKNDLAGVARHVGKSLGRSPQKEMVASAVNELAAADLLRPGASLPRRSILRGAASCVLEFGPCTYTSECCAGFFCWDPTGSGFLQCGFPS